MSNSSPPTVASLAERPLPDLVRAAVAGRDRYFLDAGDPILACDLGGRIVDLNPAAERAYGWSRRELLGRSARTLVAPGDRARHDQLMERARRGETLGCIALRQRSRDGRSWPGLLTLAPTMDALGEPLGITTSVKETSALERAHGGPCAAEERLRALIDRMMEGFALSEIIADAKGRPVDFRYLDINPAFERLTGRSRDQVVGKRASEVFPKLDPFWVETMGQVATSGRSLRFERHGTRTDQFLEVLAYSPAPGQFACLFIDITKRKRLEEKRVDDERRLQQAQKMESLGVLAGGIAHDFNNLLVGVLGHAELALDSMAEVDPSRGNVRGIVRAAKRASDLTRQMLAYSGRGKFEVEILDLNALLRGMNELLRVSIAKTAVLKQDLADSVPPIEADAAQVRQVVMNLLTNASEAIGQKSGVISIRTGARELSADDLADCVVDGVEAGALYSYLAVADTGCGMDEETRARIFEPFFTTKFTGRGLGLAAVLGIARGHGGTIEVRSEVGRGTEIRVLFPARSEPLSPERSAQGREAQTWRGEGTVLLVDDEETVRGVGKQFLMRAGFEVITAVDGREACEIYRARADEIVAVVLDLTMPRMDGDACFRELRRMRPEVKVLLSSGYNEQELRTRFDGRGFAGFVQKPYSGTVLRSKLRELLG